ncbi:MAG: hypothetical protein U9M89_02040 [Patescibacteria group bacterium]|nr:hypothetical protein [Patescibacteria group bacterium]
MAIDTDNLVNDFVLNTKAIFDENMRSLNIREVFTDDVLIIPVVPSLAISCIGFFPNRITVGRTQARYQFDFVGELWYYHSNISPDVYRNLVMARAYKISKHILENATLNGWLTAKQAIVRSCSWAPRLRSGDLLASARIILLASYNTQITSS